MEKIDILALHLGIGGIEVALSSVANMLSSKYDVRIISTYKLYENPKYKLNDNVKVKYLINSNAASLGGKLKGNIIKNVFNIYIKKGQVISLFKDTLRALKVLITKNKVMKKYIETCHADLIISTRIEFTKLLNKYYKGSALKVFWEHSDNTDNKKYLNKLVKYTNNIDIVVPVSKFISNKYAKVLTKKVIYMPLCVDYISNKKNILNNKNVVSIGRLSKEKGYLDLIDIIEVCVKKDKDIKFHIIGDGYQYKDIERKIKELGLDENITMYGYLDKDKIRSILKESSLYVTASLEESFGLVLLEAFAFGIPVIAFDSARGAKEIITDNKNGYLIKNRNKLEFSKKIFDLLNNQKKLKELGNNAYQKSLEFSYDYVKEKWCKFVDELLKDENES